MKSRATPLMPTQLTPVDVLGFVLQVVRCHTGVLGDSGKNPRSQFLVVMKGEDKVCPIRMESVRCEPDWRLTTQPIRCNAARTRRALVAGQLLTPPGTWR